jgi:glutamine amidotransferase
MRELDARGLRPRCCARRRASPFGICIGQQMLFEHSAEGDVPGLGILPGEVVRFPEADAWSPRWQRLKVPHMGWNEVGSPPASAVGRHPDGERFYFVHSYFVVPADAGRSPRPRPTTAFALPVR